MSTNDHNLVGSVLTRRFEPDEDTVLTPRMRELFDLDLEVLVQVCDLRDLTEEEVFTLFPIGRSVVSSTESTERGQERLHLFERDLVKDGGKGFARV